jgi:hypothetical protein
LNSSSDVTPASRLRSAIAEPRRFNGHGHPRARHDHRPSAHDHRPSSRS